MLGLTASSGVIEGRARIISNMEDADLEDGDILVTSFTEPGWTTLFVSAFALFNSVSNEFTFNNCDYA